MLTYKMSFLIGKMRDLNSLVRVLPSFLKADILFYEHTPFPVPSSGLCPHHRYPSIVLGEYLLCECVLAGYVLLLCTKKLRKAAAKLFTKMTL